MNDEERLQEAQKEIRRLRAVVRKQNQYIDCLQSLLKEQNITYEEYENY